MPLLNKRIVASLIASAGSVSLYLVTTNGQNVLVVISGVGSNFLINAYAADGSFRHLGDLIGEKKYKTFIATLVSGLGLSIPQGFVAFIASAADTPVVRYLAFGSTTAGTMVLNSLALKDLSGIATDVHNLALRFLLGLKQWRGLVPADEEARHYQRANMLRNLATLLDASKTFHYQQLDGDQVASMLTTADQSAKHLAALQLMYNLAHTASKPYELSAFSSVVGFVLATTLKLALSAVMLLCMFAYSCATATGLQKNFGLSSDLSTFLGILLMAPTMLLAMTGGFSLGSSMIDLVVTLSQGKIPNGFKLGKMGVFATVLAPAFATALSFYSGYTTELLFGTCARTPMKTFMDFPDGAIAANVSSAVFNTVYAQKCLRVFFAALTYQCMSTEAKNFLAVQTIFAEIMRVATSDPEKFLSDLEKEVRSSATQETGATDATGLVNALKADSRAFNATIWGVKQTHKEASATLATPLLTAAGPN